MGRSIREEIIYQAKQVANEQDRDLETLADDLPLISSGLDSLCFAILVARLERSLNLDPFTSDEDDQFPQTFGDFIQLYEKAASAATLTAKA